MTVAKNAPFPDYGLDGFGRKTRSPYLEDPFTIYVPPPKPPKTQRSILGRSVENNLNSPRFSMSRRYNPAPYQPPTVEQTYVERLRENDIKEHQFDKKYTESSRRKYPMDPYKHSMIDLYTQKMHKEKMEQIDRQTYEARAFTATHRKRLNKVADKSEQLHRDQMETMGHY